MGILTANLNFLASLGITTSEQFTAAFGDMAAFTEYCDNIGYSWEINENNDLILITPNGNTVNTYIEFEAKTATPTITVTPGNTAYTIEATGEGTVKLYIDDVEVFNPVSIERTTESQEITVTATAQAEGKSISDEAEEEITIPALDTTAAPDIDYIAGLDSYDIVATGDGTVKLYLGGSEVANPYTVIRTDQNQTLTFSATAQEAGHQISETTTEEFVIPALPVVKDYMKLSVLNESGNDGNITINIPSQVNASKATSLSYSKDGSNWTDTTIDNTAQTITIPVNAGDEVYLKGVAKQWGNSSGRTKINSTANINASGNVLSLFYGDNFENQTTFPAGSEYNMMSFFGGNTHLISAGQLELPQNAPRYCYNYMFDGCTGLTSAPALPASIMNDYCYSFMFRNCSSLTSAPALPATTLADNCYSVMFMNTAITSAPALPATTLARSCYSSMFLGCTGLTSAPALPATTLALECYRDMFSGCTSLNSITMLAEDISASNCLNNWVQNVAATGTFTKSANMTTLPTGNSGIPSGWTVQDYVAPQSLSQQMSNILGQEVEIVNDMSEQDALDEALDILGTNE